MTIQRMAKGDIGTEIRLTVVDQDGTVVNLAAATKLEIHAEAPSGATKEWTATLYGTGTDGKIKYVTVAGAIDEVGVWDLQVYVEVGAFKGHSYERLQIKVVDKIT